MTILAPARPLGIVPPPPVDGAPSDRPMKVIAVDGDEQFRRLLSDELAEYGFDVTTFPDGVALLEAASAVSAADLIILDWSLSRPSGIDLLPQLREAGVDPYTRVVSDVYQDLFGEVSFIGKGIYDVEALAQCCHAFPENIIFLIFLTLFI